MDWRTHFGTLGDHVDGLKGAGHDYTLALSAEDSDFVRFNHGKVRQPGTVHQAAATVRWIAGRRHASAEVTLTGDVAEDRQRLTGLVDDLKAVLPSLGEDPHLLLPDTVHPTEQVDDAPRVDARQATAAIVDAAASGPKPLDLVGIYAGGATHRGFRNSAGQRNWFTNHGFVVDWCLVHGADKAVKSTWAGATWDDDGFAQELVRARRDLAALDRPARRIEPGSWRAFLTPSALHELVQLASRDGFSLRLQRRRQSCLGRLVDGQVSLSPEVNLSENTAGGIAPAFQSMGFVKPDVVPLVTGGKHAGSLVSPRSAVEYGVPANGADGSEAPASIDMAGGSLATGDARAALGTGVWVSNLWYANHSDRNAARMTGMTRFATLWVEDGEVVAPLDVMRFDDSLLALLGDRLEALTTETAFLPSTSTYGWRSTSSARLPGALVSGLTFTL